MSETPPQPLGLSRGAILTIGAVLLLYFLAIRSQQPSSQEVVRVKGETISFNTIGVRVHPESGWSYLSNCEHHRAVRPTFLNESAFVIARLHAFPFQSWPPDEEELVARRTPTPLDREQTDDEPADDTSDLLPDDLQVVHREYAHVSIDWLEFDREPSQGSRFLVGRLQHGSIDLMVTVMPHSDTRDSQAALKKLCDSIETLE